MLHTTPSTTYKVHGYLQKAREAVLVAHAPESGRDVEPKDAGLEGATIFGGAAAGGAGATCLASVS